MKHINFDKSLNEKILKGVDILTKAVSATLGPKGRTCIIKGKNSKPLITKDGVSVARAIELEDPFENLGAQIIKQTAESTVLSCGDGTTTAIVLAHAIITKAQSYIAAGDSVVELRKGINKALEKTIEIIKPHAQEITSLEQIEQIATISANGDKTIGKLISLAVDKIGKDGSITIQESRTSDTVLELSEGFSFDSGLLAQAFINDERRGCLKYEDCLILVTDKNISSIDEILPILEIVARDGRPFIIIAEQVEGQALAALIMNTMKGTMKAAAIKAPKYGEERRDVLSDIALVTNAKFISRDSGINFKNIKLLDLGVAKIVESNKQFTTIVSSNSDPTKISEKIESLKNQLLNTENLRICEKIQDRITRLSSGIAIIKVGGATEVEMIEKKHRIEDALEAVSAAQKEGVIAGGGTSLFRASKYLESIEVENDQQAHGVKIIKKTICEPFKKIAENAGESSDVLLLNILTELDNWDIGYDMSSTKLCHMYESGIIDPFKVVRCALENAVSAASTLLTTSVAVVET